MSSKPKISACLIVRDAPGLERCLLSLRPHVDEIVIVDTGSQDGVTPTVARKYADKFETFIECNDAESGLIEDFALARNRSFVLATHDVVFWIDSDDELANGERLSELASELVALAPSPGTNAQILLPYEYQRDAKGYVIAHQYRERLLYPRKHWEWRFPVHETCLLKADAGTLQSEARDSVRIIHRSEGQPREQGRNLRILKKHIEKVGDSDPRSLYYLGVELNLDAMRSIHVGAFERFLASTGQSTRALKRYCEIAFSDDERALAMQTIAQNYQRLNDHGEAITWASRATHVKPWPEPYWLQMESYYALALQEKRAERSYYARGAHFGRLAQLLLAPPELSQSVQGQNPTLRYRAQEVYSVCLAFTGALKEAIEACEFGLSGLPENELLKNNVEAFRKELARRELDGTLERLDVSPNARALIHEVVKGNHVQLQLFEDAKQQSSEMPRVLHAGVRDAGTVTQPRDRGANRSENSLDILIYVGPGPEPWTGDDIYMQGRGGSETMAWQMAVQLERLGHHVILVGHLAQPGDSQAFSENGKLIDYRAALPEKCDVLISSRRPEVFDAPIRANVRILWVHDVHCGEALDHKRNARIDLIFALSNWHKSFLLCCYPTIDPAKIVVTRNGIDLSLFEQAPERRFSHRAIYSSSPDRGLDALLDAWPIVREAIPDAKLDVYYGFDNWEKCVSSSPDPEREKRAIRHLREKAERTAGVKLRGRAGKSQLAHAFLAAGVWAYPTAFTETSCITAMEAQAAGCRIVTSPIAALNETVGPRGVMVYGYGEPSFPARFAAAIIAAMTEGERVPNDRVELQRYAREHFSLEALAKEWSEMLTSLVAELRENVVPHYKSAPAMPEKIDAKTLMTEKKQTDTAILGITACHYTDEEISKFSGWLVK